MLGRRKIFNLMGGVWLLWMLGGLGSAQALAADFGDQPTSWQVAVLEPAFWRDARLQAFLTASTHQRANQRKKPTQKQNRSRHTSTQFGQNASRSTSRSTDWSFPDLSSARQTPSSAKRPKRRAAKKRRQSGRAVSRRASQRVRKESVKPEIFQIELSSDTP
ncbi:hypothetical protein [Orrella sp. 11846]|uniref:hypothetical protein n=1 Tax=Orrella sp. 11846 TaxID=3409913 RepID=UPI003B58D902